MICSIFEIFLVESLRIILGKKPEIMLGAAIEKEIKLKDILALGNYEAIIESFQEKIIERFAWSSIEEKFDFIEKKLGINKESFFDWTRYTEDIKKELEGWDLTTLIKIYDKRHKIVHHDLLFIKDIDELAQVVDFLQKIILNSAVLFRKKFEIPDTFSIMVAQLTALSEASGST